MAETLNFDMDAVTPRMLVDFKEKTGSSLMALAGADGTIAMESLDELAIAGVIWIALRMSGQTDATWDEALDTPFTSLADAAPKGQPDPS